MPNTGGAVVQTLKIVADNKYPSPVDTPTDTETGGTADKMACMLTYLKSLEQAAAQAHGDNEDWRYGRYLLHSAMIAALKKEVM
jgi:hypothetical protein